MTTETRDLTPVNQMVEAMKAENDHKLAVILAEQDLISRAMGNILKEGTDGDGDYGVLPGTKKKTLYKSGAEKLSRTFALIPKDHEIREIPMERGHREYKVTLHLLNSSGDYVGFGVGSCSTMESKYRYRKAARTCPECGNATIIKGRTEYGGGWLCYQAKGGCGKKWEDENAPEIVNQEIGMVENPDIADLYNTCLKMAKKRALVDAVLTRTAASDIFTQDLDDTSPEQTNGKDSGAAKGAQKKSDKKDERKPDAKTESENGRWEEDIQKARQKIAEAGKDTAKLSDIEKWWLNRKGRMPHEKWEAFNNEIGDAIKAAA